jgi:hypothetical protein
LIGITFLTKNLILVKRIQVNLYSAGSGYQVNPLKSPDLLVSDIFVKQPFFSFGHAALQVILSFALQKRTKAFYRAKQIALYALNKP